MDEPARLFQWGEFTLHSGDETPFLIECDAFTAHDLDILARWYAYHNAYGSVTGIKRGGERFAHALERYSMRSNNYPMLIADDVLTRGRSMEIMRKRVKPYATIGVVIFARMPCPDWITPIFKLESFSQLP